MWYSTVWRFCCCFGGDPCTLEYRTKKTQSCDVLRETLATFLSLLLPEQRMFVILFHDDFHLETLAYSPKPASQPTTDNSTKNNKPSGWRRFVWVLLFGPSLISRSFNQQSKVVPCSAGGPLVGFCQRARGGRFLFFLRGRKPRISNTSDRSIPFLGNIYFVTNYLFCRLSWLRPLVCDFSSFFFLSSQRKLNKETTKLPCFGLLLFPNLLLLLFPLFG